MDQSRPARVAASLAEFCSRPPVTAAEPGPAAEQQWLLDLFHQVAASVPAYQDFLRQHEVKAADVRTLADFRRLPLVTKENYHTRYPLSQRCRDGELASCDMIAVSSGSTGRPTYWPRFVTDELAAAARFEQIFHDSFEVHTKPTLAVVCFPLGTWVGGLYTASCCRHLAIKGYRVTVVAPGNDKEEILRVVPELAPDFAQTVLLGYPPFLKDLVDTGIARGVPWASMNIRLVLAGEVFSEDWRDLIGTRAGMRRPAHDSAALYGTADGGVLGNETPLSITIRRFLAGSPGTAQAMFGQSRLPTLVQYDPRSRFFEEHNGTLLFTADSGVPLIRYHIADEGGIVAYEQAIELCRQHGFDPLDALGSSPGALGSSPGALGAGRAVRELPFVYVFGRSHLAVSFYGANVYPENIAAGLEQPQVNAWVTGKFVLEVVEDADRNRRLAVAVELAPGEQAPDEHGDPERQRTAAQSIRTQLRRLNSEFAHYVPEECQEPQVTLLAAGDPDYFPRGVKHRYTRKSAPGG
ncbi:MAG TPA: phenylacetate--CoA ligase family protein [Streptosporangiaceae bacterium]